MLQCRWGCGHHGQHGGRRRWRSSPHSRGRSQDTWNEGQADLPPHDDKATQLVQLRELKVKLDEDRGRLGQLERALKRDQPHRMVGAHPDALETCTDRSLGIRSLNRSSAGSLELVRTSWQQPCYYTTCLSPQTPRRDAFETRCRVCSTWRQLNKQRARPLDIKGRPQKSIPSQLKTRGGCLFTKNHHLKARR